MEFRETTLPGCFEIQGAISKDARGSFVKTFLTSAFAQKDLVTEFPEEFYSVSGKKVLRGLHVQIPPGETTKIVYCAQGEVLDALVDLRKGSPTFGKFETFSLSSDAANQLYIPTGVAHGFCAVSDSAVLMYRVSREYAKEYDAGIRWDSAGIPWPVKQPLLSERDLSFPTLQSFSSPFVFRK